MSAGGGEEGDDLRVRLDMPIPAVLPRGRATAVVCCGSCFHRSREIERLEVAVDGTTQPVAAARMPRPDVFGVLHPSLAAGARGDPDSPEDPQLRSYRSGFWATVPVAARERSGSIELRLTARLDDGTSASVPFAAIDVVEAADPPLAVRAGRETIAICMATFNPDVELLRTQLRSLRAQTDRDWICLISDDCSMPGHFAAIEAAVADDPRFVVWRSERRLGFYRNFERALGMVPREVGLVALCDQDDRWYPDKLETLRASIGEAALVYSDQRLVDAGGRVLAQTLWEGRRNNHTNLASLVMANTVVGASTLFRRELLDFALPFPQGPGWEFHDHWLAMLALACGEIGYVDRPLYDYVQHANAILGQAGATGSDGPRRGPFRGWRAMYFCGYLEVELHAHVLLARCAHRLTPRKRRTLRRLAVADRSPLAFAWLALRPLRELVGRNETLGTETLLARGIAWRRMVTLRSSSFDASPPGCGPDNFDQRRLRRWLARR